MPVSAVPVSMVALVNILITRFGVNVLLRGLAGIVVDATHAKAVRVIMVS